MSKRRANDFYPTPAWATEILLESLGPLTGRITEPCAGRGHISNVLKAHDYSVLTNDIDDAMPTDMHLDARDLVSQETPPAWYISNPPFGLADEMVPALFRRATVGIAMLLRLSWLEPTKARGAFLAEHPPTELIVLPRISFDGSGKTDTVTTAWFVWFKQPVDLMAGFWIEIVPRRAPQRALVEVKV